MSKRNWLVIIALAGAPNLGAQTAATTVAAPRPVDQMFVLDMAPVLIPTPSVINASTLDLAESQLEEVVLAVLKATTGCTPCNIDPSTYYLVHLVEHVPGKVDSRRQRWYTYFRGWPQASAGSKFVEWLGDPYRSRHYREARLYGARRLTVMYLHYNIGYVDTSIDGRERFAAQLLNLPPVTAETLSDFAGSLRARANGLKAQFGDKYLEAEIKELEALADLAVITGVDPEAIGKTRADIEARMRVKVRRAVDQAFDDTLGIQHPNTDLAFTLVSRAGNALEPVPFATVAGGASVLVEKGYLPLSYQIEVTKKQPDNLRNAIDAAGAIFMGGPAAFRAPLSQPAYALCAVQEGMQILHPTSDITVKGFRGQDEKRREITSQLFDNEGRHWWDFSFAFPAKGVEDLKLEAVAGQPGVFTGRKVERKNVFATANLFPVPVDTKRRGLRFIPQLMYGVGITKKPFDNQLFAIGIGTSVAQPFFGRMYSRTESRDAAGNPIFTKDWKWTWGINLQPRSVLAIFKQTAGAK